jgi:hypothetical protein
MDVPPRLPFQRLLQSVILAGGMVFGAGALAQDPPPPPKARPKPALASKPKPLPPKPAPVIGPLKFNDVMTAVVYRDLPALNDLLALGKWPDKPDSQGLTPLTVAALYGYEECVDALLKAGADPEPALRAAKDLHNPAIVPLLRRRGPSGSAR